MENKLNKLLLDFKKVSEQLSAEWQISGKDLSEDYPFTESFDEIEIGKWVDKCLMKFEDERRFNAFIRSRAIVPKGIAVGVNWISPEFSIFVLNVLVYFDRYWICILDNNNYYTEVCGSTCESKSLEIVEQHLWDMFVKEESKNIL